MLHIGSNEAAKLHPISQEPDMNAFSISLFAIVIVAALAAVAPVTRYTQHEFAVLSAHAASARGQVQPAAGSGLAA
ncbi:hypothetical protein A9R05_37055 (plasmid) [Burkholderia sp. KK1]|nr:hypothetical protein A9R05_37055 [Burkholderia sp. KK1]